MTFKSKAHIFCQRTIFTGLFSDWLTIRLARRNGGIMEAEHRLYPFLLCVFIVPGSLILWGVGASHHVQWFGLIFAMWLLSFCSACGVTLSVNYMVDSYRQVSGQAITTMILIRNTMSFAISYGYVYVSLYMFPLTHREPFIRRTLTRIN